MFGGTHDAGPDSNRHQLCRPLSSGKAPLPIGVHCIMGVQANTTDSLPIQLGAATPGSASSGAAVSKRNRPPDDCRTIPRRRLSELGLRSHQASMIPQNNAIAARFNASTPTFLAFCTGKSAAGQSSLHFLRASRQSCPASRQFCPPSRQSDPACRQQNCLKSRSTHGDLSHQIYRNSNRIGHNHL